MNQIVPPPWRLSGNGAILLYRFPRPWAMAHGHIPPELRPAFVGGLGGVVLADYAASGVGPYREALFIPGQFWLGGARRFAITRIYVSTAASVASGRANWAIPKQLAAIDRDGDSFAVRVGARQAFSASLRPFGPQLPVDTAWSPIPLVLGQPAGGLRYETRPAARGALRLARVAGLRADPALFPDVASLRPLLAVRITGFQLVFPEPRLFHAGAAAPGA